MQLHLTLSCERLSLPMSHRHHLQSMIYNALRSDCVFSEALHDGNLSENENSSRQFKLFTFSQLKGNYTLKPGEIIFSGDVSLEVRSLRDEMVLLLMKNITRGKEIRLMRNLVKVKACLLQNQIISSDSAYIRTISPIVAYVTNPDGSTEFFSPNDDRFCDLIIANARRKWESAGKPAEDFLLTAEPDFAKEFRKQVTRFKSTYITAWDGFFRLKGNPEVLDFLYNTGLGAKSSQGFGMFTVI